MPHYSFEWDIEKARANEKKHDVTFDEATSCFRDVFAIESFDVHHSHDEDRFAMIGSSNRERVLVVAYTIRNHAKIRIISARTAMRHERLQYEEKIGTR